MFAKKLLFGLLFIFVNLGLIGMPVFSVNEVSAQKLNLYEGAELDEIVTGNVVNKTLKDNDQDLNKGFFSDILPIINRVLGAVGILFFVILGIKYVFSGGDSEKQTKLKQEIMWIIIGLALISVAEFIGFRVFNPTQDIIDGDEAVKNLNEKIREIIRFLEYLIGGIFLVHGIFSGYNLITAGDNEETINKEKKFFLNFVLGALFILTSEVILRVLVDDISTDERVGIITGEVAGIVNMILTFLAGACTIMLILASLYYVASFGNEEQTTRAKKIIIGCVFGLVLAFSSYVIANFLIV